MRESSDMDRLSESATVTRGAMDTSSGDVCFLRAVDMAQLIREKKLSAREAMEAHLKQIKRVNEKVNAIGHVGSRRDN